MLEAMLTSKNFSITVRNQCTLNYLCILYYTGGGFAEILNELVILKSENLMVFNIQS